MLNSSKIFLSFKLNLKNRVRKSVQTFKKNFSETKKKPRSEIKFLLLDFTIVLSVFGVTLFVLVLSAKRRLHLYL